MQTISVQDAHKLMTQEKVTLIDVREEDEFKQAHIEGAQLAPLSNLPVNIKDVQIPKDKKVIIYCLKGGRSAQAIEFLSENILKDFNVYNLEGGIKDWAEQDLPLVQPNTI